MDWKKILGSAVYTVTHYSADHDISAPFEVVVTAPATGAWWVQAEVIADATETLLIEEGVAIGVAGTAMTFRRLVRDGDHPDANGPAVEQGGTYTGGTELYQSVVPGARPYGIPFKLVAGTIYQFTVTSAADNNVAALHLMAWKGP